MKKLNNKKKPRASGFTHIGEIIPGVLEDIERKIKKNTQREKKEEEMENQTVAAKV